MPRGNTDRHRVRERAKRSGNRLTALLTVMLLCIAAISLYILAGEAGDRLKARELERQLRLESVSYQPEITQAPTVTPSATADPVRFEGATRTVNSSDTRVESAQYIGDAPRSECAALLKRNSDFIGKIRIDSTLDLPVVYRDNTFYLTHDFDGEPSSSGTPFLDETHPFEADTQYLIIHGHNVYDGSMFAMLTHYRNAAFAQQHSEMTFYTLYRRETYRLFAVVSVSKGDYADVIGVDKRSFDTDAEYDDFIGQLRSHALFFDDAEIDRNKAFIALSTCRGDDRFVVFFYRDDTADGEA